MRRATNEPIVSKKNPPRQKNEDVSRSPKLLSLSETWEEEGLRTYSKGSTDLKDERASCAPRVTVTPKKNSFISKRAVFSYAKWTLQKNHAVKRKQSFVW